MHSLSRSVIYLSKMCLLDNERKVILVRSGTNSTCNPIQSGPSVTNLPRPTQQCLTIQCYGNAARMI